MLEDFGIPVPGETVLIAASVYACAGRLNVVAVGVVAFIAAVTGDNIGFAIGYFGGRALAACAASAPSGRPSAGRRTPTEVKIAALVAGGDLTSDIARGMFLSRRTVQTYISRILAKLGAKGRVDIVREALRQGVSP